MNNVIAIFLLLASLPISTKAGYLTAKLVYVNGTETTGLAEYPDEPVAKYINFKADKKSDKQKISSEELKKIVFYNEKNEPFEVERIKTWQYNLKRERKIGPPVWLFVVVRGPVTLYTITAGGSVTYKTTGASIVPSDTYCFVKKESESEGTLIHYKINATISVAKNATFHAMGQEYFADNAAIAEKIKTKEYTYKDVVTVVETYNDWVKKGKK